MIVVDHREPKEVAARLRELGMPVEVKQISPGDYIVGDVAVERKTVSDFFGSLVNQRIFDQLERLRASYPVPLILVEGDLTEIAEYKNPRAFWGAFLKFTLDDDVPLVFTPDQEQTCQVLVTLHKRMSAKAAEYALRHKPKVHDLEERQRFLVQGLPSVGETLSQNLLDHFGTPRNVFLADEHALASVPKIGSKKASEIVKVLTTKWEGRQKRIEDEP
ncbi:MAG TPA: ERCC4 domain-containing protein [Thermoplasmata archaeon]|nr:ERCC4 domain-containing protein [Thermoplasmata archaeon]